MLVETGRTSHSGFPGLSRIPSVGAVRLVTQSPNIGRTRSGAICQSKTTRIIVPAKSRPKVLPSHRQPLASRSDRDTGRGPPPVRGFSQFRIPGLSSIRTASSSISEAWSNSSVKMATGSGIMNGFGLRARIDNFTVGKHAREKGFSMRIALSHLAVGRTDCLFEAQCG
jgi:hypothetical protein